MIPEYEFADEPIYCPYCGDLKGIVSFYSIVHGVLEEAGLVCLCPESVMNHMLSGMIFHVFYDEDLVERFPELAYEPVEIM